MQHGLVSDLCCWSVSQLSTARNPCSALLPLLSPANSVVPPHSSLVHNHVAATLDNTAIYDICRRNGDTEKLMYTHLNRLCVANSPPRRPRHRGPTVCCTWIPPSSKLTSAILSYPLRAVLLCLVISAEKACHAQLSFSKIGNAIFDAAAMMPNSEPCHTQYLVCCLICHGDVMPKDVNTSVATINTKCTVQFCVWSPSSSANSCPVVPSGPKVRHAACTVSNSPLPALTTRLT